MFSVVPREFLPGVKNPCWYEEYRGNFSTDPYRTNGYADYSSHIKMVFQHLRNTFREHLIRRDGKLYRMRCLPYFYIVGQPKCGTTDLHDRLRLHPHVKFTISKEPHWWTRKRFGESPDYLRKNDEYHLKGYKVEISFVCFISTITFDFCISSDYFKYIAVTKIR